MDADHSDKVAVVYTTDHHINGATALFPRQFTFDDGGQYIPSRSQFALADAWGGFAEQVQALLGDYRIVSIFGGDLVDVDDKQRTTQVVSRNPSDVFKMAQDVIYPLASISQSLYFIRGTEAHVGTSAFVEEDLGGDFDNTVRDDETGNYSWWYLRRRFGGVSFDVTHHTSMGGIPWTQRNAANTLAARLMFEYAERGEKAPQIALRGHVHRWSDSYDNFPVRAMTCGCWAFQNAYSHRIGKGNALPEIGGAILLCENGQYEVKKIRYTLPFPPMKEG